jgi:hypothetical protein
MPDWYNIVAARALCACALYALLAVFNTFITNLLLLVISCMGNSFWGVQ